MFQENTRYMTKGISERLPPHIIALLWLCIDMRISTGEKLDYLQVFKFEKISDEALAVRHEQEQPARLFVHYTNYKEEYADWIRETIFVVDDKDHSTMLFGYEY